MLVFIFALGLAMGLISKWISNEMIIHRQGDISCCKLIKGKYSQLLWALISAIVYLIIFLSFPNDNLKIIECMLVFSVCLVISAVDLEIRKIPNEMLLLLLISKIVLLIASNGDFGNAIVGLFFAAIVFMFPANFGKSIGMGDIKLAMIIGFFLGPIGFVQAIAIMGLSLLFYWLYLMFTHKGGLKTSIALGPYIAFGFVSTLCVSLPINILS